MESGANKKSTEARLTIAAISLFARKWYGTVSVAEICRAAGSSNGVFYRYFDSKEALFRSILTQVLELIRELVDGVEGGSVGERLTAFTQAIFRFSAENRELVSVFREGQYRFFDYERRLIAIYVKGLGRALGREVGLNEYLFALGGLRFCAVRSALQGAMAKPSSATAIIERGLFRGMTFDPARVFGGEATPLPLALEEGARERLLRAGKRLFGEKGYFETNIHEITDAASLSVGAFYIYFGSKEAFYAELMQLVGHEIRAFISRNLGEAGSLNRLERELRGLWLFLVYLSIDRNCYNVVREAEFVLPQAVRDYYGAFVEGYRKNPEGNSSGGAQSEVDEATAIEFLLGIAHYFGIEIAFDESPHNARAAVEAIGGYLAHGFSAWLGEREE